jgi:hypothetical protein
MAFPGTFRFPELATTPSVPPAGYALIYMKTDNVLYILDSAGVETPIGSASFITALTGDVVATGPGAAAAVVMYVGGKTSAEVAQSVTDTQNATSANTANFIVKRDGSGNIFVTQINGVVVEAHASRHLPSGADPLTTAAPAANLSATTTNATGTANSLARSDHSHAISTGTPSTQTADQSNATGSSANLARADHIHNIPTDVPVDIGSSNSQGTSVNFSKADHVHKGLRSIKANSGTQRFADVSLKDGAGTTVNDDGSGNFSVNVTGGASEFVVTYPGSGLTVNYTGGKIEFNGTHTVIVAGSVLLPSMTTNGYVYIDIDAVVKSGVTLPPNVISLAIFTTSLTSVTVLDDARVFLNQNLVWGLTSDIQPETTTSSASAGTLEKYARADHVHAITSSAASTQTPDQSNSAGVSANFSKADHVHNIPTATAVGLDANSTNTQGVAATFGRSDHTHDLATGVVSTQTPNQSNAEGVSANLARADHTHNVPTAAPTTNLSATTTNDDGVAASFSKSDHSHAITTGTASTQTPNQSNATGTSANLARADHVHNIPTAAAVTQLADQSNADGVAATFAKSDHIHNIPSATPVQIGTSNFQGAATTVALSDHVHAHGNQTSGTLHAAATGSVNGFMSAADKTKLDASTSSNTPSTLVQRDSSGNFSAGTISAALNGNATTATSATTATNFSGSLSGDVSGTQGATVVNTVGTSTAANIHTAELAANAATNLSTASTIVKRDSSGLTHLKGLELDGATSGTMTHKAADVTTSYQVKWPAAQGPSGSVPFNDGLGNLTWVNPQVNIDGGTANSVYTAAQVIDGGTP